MISAPACSTMQVWMNSGARKFFSRHIFLISPWTRSSASTCGHWSSAHFIILSSVPWNIMQKICIAQMKMFLETHTHTPATGCYAMADSHPGTISVSTYSPRELYDFPYHWKNYLCYPNNHWEYVIHHKHIISMKYLHLACFNVCAAPSCTDLYNRQRRWPVNI